MMVLCMSLALCTILTLSEAASLNSSILIAAIHKGLCSQSKSALFGAYVPQCDSNGNFLPQQCWASSGYCWCVNILTGKEIPGTRTPPGTPPVDCGNYGNVENNFCPTGWSRHGNRCFIFIDTSKTWAEAETYCVFEGATLASVHSSEENRFIQVLTRGDTHDFPITWIGGQDAIQNGLWMWSDGSMFDYKNWHNGQGGSAGEPCLYMNFGAELLWNDYSCTYRYPFVCAKRISTLP